MPGSRGECRSQEPLKKSYQKLTFVCDSAGCNLRMFLHEGAGASLRLLQADWLNEIDAEVRIPWRS